MKKTPLLLALFCLAIVSTALPQGGKLLLHDQKPPLIAAPDFTRPSESPWKATKGKWTAKNGTLEVTNIPAEKHIPVFHHNVGLSSAVIECEFRFDSPGAFYLGCDSNKHVGRVIINAVGIRIAEDATKPSHTIAELKMPIDLKQWHHLRFEWKGDEMAATLDGKSLRAQNPFLATKKSRSWIAAGDSAQIRNFTIHGVKN